MQIKSRITDIRIDAENVFIECTYKEYLEIARGVIQNNELQRRRVKSSNTVYSLLRTDLKRGCLVPPIVLALSNGVDQNFNDMSDQEILQYIETKKDQIVILDGLQRTYTLIDVESEITSLQDPEQLQTFYQHKLRIELYLGINKFGILYRMLTLNTGQTPMSIRHQVEILYKDYTTQAVNGVRLVAEVDGENINELGKYKFQDIIDGFNSYLERNEFPIDRFEILNNIKGLEKLSEENQRKDVFKDFLQAYNKFVLKVDDLTHQWTLDAGIEKELELTGQPFGKTAFKVFNKSQAITGFGAAIGKLKDFESVLDFEQCESIIEQITFNGEPDEWMISLLEHLDKIRSTSKKIGNSQRVYFHFFFRELFNKDSDSYLNLNRAVINGFNKYRSQME